MSAADKNDIAVTSPTDGVLCGDRYRSPAQIERNAARAASALHDNGVWQGDVVALLLRNDFAYFEATAAASRLGAASVPLNWHLAAEEIAYILDDCGAKVLIAHTDLLTEEVVAICSRVTIIAVQTPPEVCAAYAIEPARARLIGALPEWSQWFAGYEPWTRPARSIVSPMFYTSGTTGRPKGVRRGAPPVQMIQRIQQRTGTAFGLDQPPVRSVMTGPLYHSAPNAYGMRVVADGGLLVLQPRFDPEELLALIEKHRVTHLHMVPTMFVRLLALPESTRRRYDLTSLRHVVHGSAACPQDVKQRMIEWWGPVINEYYAMTETGIITVNDSAGWLSHRGSVGRAAPGVNILIADDELNPCPPNVAGEICMRAEHTAFVTYHRADSKTAAMRLGDFVRTGDIGHLDEDGYLYISDRKSDMVISGGSNIYPAEIETLLITMPGLRDCAVFGVPDAEYGERLIAVVDAQEQVSEQAVRGFLDGRIARYKVPREIIFDHDLPREDSGKIKKRLLRSRYLERMSNRA
ncbi:MAG: AMP-binding protein [Steroidobacteraceae bacterium]